MLGSRAMTPTSPRQKLWLEADGQLVMSDYRVRLLELIGESGSLAEAAEELGLSYRRAWGKIKELEANLDRDLVRSEVGGAGGGRTTLTAEAEALGRRLPPLPGARRRRGRERIRGRAARSAGSALARFWFARVGR